MRGQANTVTFTFPQPKGVLQEQHLNFQQTPSFNEQKGNVPQEQKVIGGFGRLANPNVLKRPASSNPASLKPIKKQSASLCQDPSPKTLSIKPALKSAQKENSASEQRRPSFLDRITLQPFKPGETPSPTATQAPQFSNLALAKPKVKFGQKNSLNSQTGQSDDFADKTEPKQSLRVRKRLPSLNSDLPLENSNLKSFTDQFLVSNDVTKDHVAVDVSVELLD